MQPGQRQVSGAVPARILLNQKKGRALSLRSRVCLRLPVALLKTASAEVIGDAVAVAADAVMDEAKPVAMDEAKHVAMVAVVVPSHVWRGPRSRVLLLPFLPQLLRVIRNRDGPSSLGRRRGISRFSCPENRFPRTAVWRNRQRRSNGHRRTRGINGALRLLLPRPLRRSQSLPHLWLLLSRTMSPSLPVPVPLR